MPIGPSGSTPSGRPVYSSFFRPLMRRQPSQMRLPSTSRLLPRMPGSTNTAGLSLGRFAVARARRLRPRRRGAARFARPRQRPDDAKAGGRVLRQRVDDGFGSALVAEVVEVRDLAALVEHEASRRSGRPWQRRRYIERVCTTRSLSVQ